jgi:hypothetical protein
MPVLGVFAFRVLAPAGTETLEKRCTMTEFHAEMRDRAATAVRSLRQAQDNGDDYLVEVREAELENLARLASDHGLRIPELQAYTAA